MAQLHSYEKPGCCSTQEPEPLWLSLNEGLSSSFHVGGQTGLCFISPLPAPSLNAKSLLSFPQLWPCPAFVTWLYLGPVIIAKFMGVFTQIATINENLPPASVALYALFIVSHLILTQTLWEHKSHFITEILGSKGRKRWLLCLSLKKKKSFFKWEVEGGGILVFVILFIVLLCLHNQLFFVLKTSLTFTTLQLA